MDREDLGRLCDARDTICEYCDGEDCEGCIVQRIVSDALSELGDEDED